MRKISALIIAFAVILSYSMFTDYAISEQSQRKYIGVKKCKMCHSKSKSGAQYKIWASTKHAKAYETLGTAESKEIAKKLGIEDPQKDEKCLKCHVTAYGVDAKLLGKAYKMEDGVTCEACHGAGGDYWKKKTMVNLISGKIEPQTVGLQFPKEEDCKKCHNEASPTYKEFNFDEMFKKIAHPIPDEYKAKKGYK